MQIRALLEAAVEYLPEVKVAFLGGALEDSNKSIGLSLLKIHCQIFMVGKAFCLLLGGEDVFILGLGILLASSGFLGLLSGLTILPLWKLRLGAGIKPQPWIPLGRQACGLQDLLPAFFWDQAPTS
ncbi:hypothetical protein DSO57_1035161 [Entomophthora muscae]|uniref:Uncharacterized protein n=1 Tax=Entomophthora muscae TaxID=34485 RepID=A0ACC2TAN1_9FUNG|nr:hypothetical protein DSO57_1035161 [Entomophthora muscae]